MRDGIKLSGYLFLILSLLLFIVSLFRDGYIVYGLQAVSILNLLIGIGLTNYSDFIENDEQKQDFQKWLLKLIIRVGYEGLYIGIIVTLAIQLITNANTNEESENKIEQLEERIAVLEEDK